MTQALANVRLLAMDVDGVLTDGTIYFGPEGEIMKGFNSLDGAGITFFHTCGLETAIITGRKSPQVRARAENLGIAHVFMGIDDKLSVLEELLGTTGKKPGETAFIGDDLPDLPAMKRCGVSFAPANSAPEVLEHCTVRLSRRGGEGAVREAIEMILKAAGQWDGVLKRYFL